MLNIQIESVKICIKLISFDKFLNNLRQFQKSKACRWPNGRALKFGSVVSGFESPFWHGCW